MKGEKRVLNFTEQELNLLTFEEQQLVSKLSNAMSLSEQELEDLNAIFEKVRNAKD